MPNELCPVKAIKHRLQNAGLTPTSLFGHHDVASKRRKHLTRADVMTTIQKVWKKGGFDGISGHSFRVGGASLRYAFKIPVKEIKELGRWTLDSWKLYIREYSQEDTRRAKEIIRELNAKERQR
jgi:hypothetical protein